MRLFFMLYFTISFSQVQNYTYGYEGMEIVSRWRDSTLIYSHSGAKAIIRREVGDSIVKMYSRDLIKDGDLKVKIGSAEIIGKIKIQRVKRLISVTFTYFRVIWNSGLIEEYRPKPKPKKKS